MSGALGFLKGEVDKLVAEGSFSIPSVVSGEQKARCIIDGREVVNLSSNNYLGLATHEFLRNEAIHAVEAFGVGSGAVRTIAGTLEIHQELERGIAAFKQTEAALVFQSGFSANAGTVSCILGEEDLIVSDALNHASIIDGCRLSRAKIMVYAHKDVRALEEILRSARGGYRRTLVVSDGVFSMDGDIAPLPEIVEAARRYGAITMVDDAHATGVLGSHGRGTVDHFGLHGQVDIQIGTLSKAIGVVGGYVAGEKMLIDYLLNRARPILFSTSHPPADAAACLAAIRLLSADDSLIRKVWDNRSFFCDGLTSLGYDVGGSQTPIIPVIVGENALASELSRELFEGGVFAKEIYYPTVPKGKARVRCIVTAAHTREDLEQALSAFDKAGSKLGLLRG